MCINLRLKDVQTYIQSGNVIFTAAEKDVCDLASRMADALHNQFGFRPEVMLRTAAEMRRIVLRNPFTEQTGVEPHKVLVGFMASKPSSEARNRLLALEAVPEEVRLSGSELYVYYPNGVGGSKLSWAKIERALNAPVTGRNWNTVLKLVAMTKNLT